MQPASNLALFRAGFGIVTTLALGAIAAGCYLQEAAFTRGMAVAPGTVVAIDSERVTPIRGPQYSADMRARVSYQVDGQPFTVHSRFFGIPRWQVHDRVAVLYRPAAPQVARLDRPDDRHALALLFGGWFALCAVALGVSRMIRRLRRAA